MSRKETRKKLNKKHGYVRESCEAEEYVLLKSPPPLEAGTIRTEEEYTVHIRLPLAALKGLDRMSAILNAFRLESKAGGTQKLYALNPTLCATFHRAEYFCRYGGESCRP